MHSPSSVVEVSEPALAYLVNIARKAGDAIMPHYGATESAAKADGSPLTAADLAADRLITEALTAWDANVPIVSEESTAAPYATRRDWKRFWLVDPLDGTKEFLTRNGEFTVNIALIEDGRPILGVVHAPAIDRTYFAGRGLGAWRQDGVRPAQRIYSSPAGPETPLRVVVSRSHAGAADEALLQGREVSQRIGLGSSLKLCCVAEGSADAYPRSGPVMEWDVAAGDCVFRYSGRDGDRNSPLRYNTDDLRIVGFVLGL